MPQSCAGIIVSARGRARTRRPADPVAHGVGALIFGIAEVEHAQSSRSWARGVSEDAEVELRLRAIDSISGRRGRRRELRQERVALGCLPRIDIGVAESRGARP